MKWQSIETAPKEHNGKVQGETHFTPDRSDTRYQDDFDKRCVRCGWPGMDHDNGTCPKS